MKAFFKIILSYINGKMVVTIATAADKSFFKIICVFQANFTIIFLIEISLSLFICFYGIILLYRYEYIIMYFRYINMINRFGH